MIVKLLPPDYDIVIEMVLMRETFFSPSSWKLRIFIYLCKVCSFIGRMGIFVQISDI